MILFYNCCRSVYILMSAAPAERAPCLLVTDSEGGREGGRESQRRVVGGATTVCCAAVLPGELCVCVGGGGRNLFQLKFWNFCSLGARDESSVSPKC